MFTWITIFHFATFGQAFDSQCNKDASERQRLEMLETIDHTFFRNNLNSEQDNLRNLFIYYFYLDQFNLYRVFIRRGHRAKQRCSKISIQISNCGKPIAVDSSQVKDKEIAQQDSLQSMKEVPHRDQANFACFF